MTACLGTTPPSTSPCTPAGPVDACQIPGCEIDPANAQHGICVAGHMSQPDSSTPPGCSAEADKPDNDLGTNTVGQGRHGEPAHRRTSCTNDQCNQGCSPTPSLCTPPPASTSCTPTGPVDPCQIPGCEIDPANAQHGICVAGHLSQPDSSTPPGCSAEADKPDNDLCTHPGCLAGHCEPAHTRENCPTDQCNQGCNPTTGMCTPVPPSTTCTPDVTAGPCQMPGCDIDPANAKHGICVASHMNKPDSTTCGPDTTPGDACVPGCEAGQCVQTHVCVQLGCRVTGGGTVDACGPGDSGCDPSTPGSCAPNTCDSPALNATHGGQVGAPIGVATPFTQDSACIAGEWSHVRHIRPRLFGNFQARSFDSLECACLPCPENPDAPGVVGALCNPDDRICGPEPRRAPANKICFSGPGDYALTNGKRDRRSVVFRVDVEDRSEPGGTNGPPPPDRYRMRIWFVDPASSEGMTLRQAVACANPTTEDISAPPPNIDDGGDLIRGNQQIHPPLKKTCTP